MKAPWVFLRESAVAAVVLGTVLATHVAVLYRHLPAVEQFIAQIVQRPTADLLESAQRQKDDLLQQRIALAQLKAEGIVGMSVLNAQKQIVIDADPPRIGRPFERVAGLTPWGSALFSGEQEWGTLAVTLSFPPLRTLSHQHLLWGIVLALVSWAVLAWRWWVIGQKGIRDQHHIHELQALLSESQQALARREDDFARYQKNAQVWIHHLIQETSQTGVLLDDRQCVVSGEWAGRSWQEVPLLQEAGNALVDALENPGKEITALGSEGRRTLEFHAFPAGATPATGVRVRFL